AGSRGRGYGRSRKRTGRVTRGRTGSHSASAPRQITPQRIGREPLTTSRSASAVYTPRATPQRSSASRATMLARRRAVALSGPPERKYGRRARTSSGSGRRVDSTSFVARTTILRSEESGTAFLEGENRPANLSPA